MLLKKRFRFIFVSIIVVPLAAMLVSGMIIYATWSSRYDSINDLEAPRYLQPALYSILTGAEDEIEETKGVIFLLDGDGQMIYAHEELLKLYPDILEPTHQWETSGKELYSMLMENMPPVPFSVSIYRYKGEGGVVVFVPDLVSPHMRSINVGVNLIWIFYLGFILLPTLAMNYFLRPMARALVGLEKAAGEIGRGNWDVEVPMQGKLNHPLNHLIEAFDEMRRELKENHERQSRIMMSISHDLKTPLTSIKGYVEALQDGMAQNPEDVDLYTSIIMEKADLLEERISDLIHFTRLQTTEWKNRFTRINLVELLNEAGNIFRNDALIRKRSMELDLPLGPDKVIEGDRRMLFQVLENLFDNACRYTDEGDSIRFSVKVMDNKALISMEDSGPGIDDDHISHIFDSFYRADSGRNTRGLGVGLASAKTIVQSHGGEIYYTKTPLGGAGFLIELPLIV